LRGPLRAIRSFAQILGEECLDCVQPSSSSGLGNGPFSEAKWYAG
jgi:hypothetical protein